MGYVAGALLLLAFLLQAVTLRHASVKIRPLVRAGKRIMAAGFLLAGILFLSVAVLGQPDGFVFGMIAFAAVALGSILSNIERVVGT